MINILLTSSGGLTGVFLSKHFRSRNDLRVIAIDRSDQNPIKNWVDVFYKVPSLEDEDYLQVIKQIIKKKISISLFR